MVIDFLRPVEIISSQAFAESLHFLLWNISLRINKQKKSAFVGNQDALKIIKNNPPKLGLLQISTSMYDTSHHIIGKKILLKHLQLAACRCFL